MTRDEELRAIGADLDLCDMGEALTKGALCRRYQSHRKACLARLREMNREDGLDAMSDDEILAELGA